jgi:hypothetical protein
LPGGQDLADKLSRNCRHIVASGWYPAALPDAHVAAARGDAGIRPDRAGLPARHLGGGMLTGRGAGPTIICGH